MKKNVRGILTWIPLEEGGRKVAVSKGIRYCPIISFSENREPEEWSADIIIIETDGNKKSVVDLTFLLDNAPFELLQKDVAFRLFEGNKLVANGVVVE